MPVAGAASTAKHRRIARRAPCGPTDGARPGAGRRKPSDPRRCLPRRIRARSEPTALMKNWPRPRCDMGGAGAISGPPMAPPVAELATGKLPLADSINQDKIVDLNSLAAGFGQEGAGLRPGGRKVSGRSP